jgi:hypothetical protein
MSSKRSTRAPHRSRWGSIFLVVALAFATFTAGCRSGSSGDDPHMKPTRPIEDVLRDHSSELMAIDGVVGLYQTVLDDGTPCLKVMVVKNTKALAAKVPKRLEGYRVEIDETGVIKPLGH